MNPSNFDHSRIDKKLPFWTGLIGLLLIALIASVALAVALFGPGTPGPQGPQGKVGPQGPAATLDTEALKAEVVEEIAPVTTSFEDRITALETKKVPEPINTEALKAEVKKEMGGELVKLRKELREALEEQPVAKATPVPAPAPEVQSGREVIPSFDYNSYELDYLPVRGGLVLVRTDGGQSRGFGRTWPEPSSVAKPKGWEKVKWTRNSRGDWWLQK